MRHKALREQDKVFASQFDSVLDNNSMEQIRKLCVYITENNLNAKEMFGYVGWKVGDKKKTQMGYLKILCFNETYYTPLTFYTDFIKGIHHKKRRKIND